VIVEHVSDTARIVAAHRARETQRADGLIRDPFAALLSGEKGMAIAFGDPLAEYASFRIGLRDRFVDDLLAGVIQREAIETVVNLGAGLDTRPWRLNLPAGLRWIEVDFEDMLAYKAEQLRNERPHCLFEQIAADISLPADRARVFDAIGDRTALVITEGLLMYLPKETLEALSSEMFAAPAVRRWLLDVVSRESRFLMECARERPSDLHREIENLRPKDHLQGKEILDLAAAHDWQEAEFRSYARDAIRVAPDRVLESRAERVPENDPSGVYLFGRPS